MPSQQCSFSGMRTAFTPHAAMARIARAPVGPAKKPSRAALDAVQAYSAPERFTPSSRICRPCASTRPWPDTWRRASTFPAWRRASPPHPAHAAVAAIARAARRRKVEGRTALAGPGDRANLDPHADAAEARDAPRVGERLRSRRRKPRRGANGLSRDDVVEFTPAAREVP